MAIADVLDLLACPACTGSLGLTPDRRSVACPEGHTYDVARQGYLNLLGGQQPRNADTTAMVSAREAFLSAGHYGPIAEHLAALAARRGRELTVLDAGGGTGYYLAAVLGSLHGARGISLDVSVAAGRRAAKAHSRVGAVVADVWKRLPVLDGAVDLVLDVFAPRNPTEFARVLKPEGHLIVVHPEPDHLAELIGPLNLLSIDAGKAERLDAGLGSLFTCEKRQPLRFNASMDRAAVQEVVGMGPNAFHLSAAQIEESLDSLSLGPSATVPVTVSVSVSLWSSSPPRPSC